LLHGAALEVQFVPPIQIPHPWRLPDRVRSLKNVSVKGVFRTKRVFLDSRMRNSRFMKSFRTYRGRVLREPMFWMLAIICALSGICQYQHTL
jgi:hypothetical protein